MKKLVTIMMMMMVILAVSCANDSTSSDENDKPKVVLNAGDVTIAEADVEAAITLALFSSISDPTATVGAVTATGDLVGSKATTAAATPYEVTVAAATEQSAREAITYSKTTFVSTLETALNSASDKFDVKSGTVADGTDGIITVTVTLKATGNYSLSTDLDTYVVKITVTTEKWA